MSTTTYSLHWTLKTTGHISCVSFGPSGHLVSGSADGSVRLYRSDSPMVSKAIRGLGSEVEAVAFMSRHGTDNDNVWIAIGQKALLFQLNSQKMILTASDAIESVQLGDNEEEALNEITLNHNESKLAFTMDTGVVGVVDLITKKSSRMRVQHANIGWAVKFIPDRPNEIISGGYDCALLHFDFTQGSLLSRFDFATVPPESGVSLSPPFILSTAVSSTGIVAAGTADGRIWIGTGGEKCPADSGSGGKKKKSRKWEGLKEDKGLSMKIAEGPVVGLAFIGSDSLISCTLLGTVTHHQLSRTGVEKALELTATWTQETTALVKVNAISVTTNRIAIGGIGKNENGVVEIWIANSL